MSDAITPLTTGAVLTDAGVCFRVWAPKASAIDVHFDGEGGSLALQSCAGGYFAGLDPAHGAGARYKLAVDGRGPFPDPCSRYQPDGPHGYSMVVDSQAYRWHDQGWLGREMKGQVFYEMHVGTFTPAGTLDAACGHMDRLRSLGITLIELMPVAEFPGRWNWGYDGVQLFAPYHGYGDYDALKRFVDAAHACGLGVILDVVYNHLGPDGNYLSCFSSDYFTDRYSNEWSDALNFDGPNAGSVRQFFIDNARYWIEEFHLDGLRLDATQSMFDLSPRHVLIDIVEAARAAAAPRAILLVGENEPQRSHWLLPANDGGLGLDALWNDDFHHSARVALTGRPDGYLHDYRGRAQEFVSGVKRGFLFQGQHYQWQNQARGEPMADQPAWAVVNFLQNHDQIANTFDGRRLGRLGSAARIRAMTALLLLGPQTPLLFMGQEFGAETPFTFFADHKADLRAPIHAGRRSFLAQFRAYGTPEAQACVPDPGDPRTFHRCQMDFSAGDQDSPWYRLHQDLLRLRREDVAIAAQDRQAIDGATFSEHALALRWFAGKEGDRLLLLNFGAALAVRSAAEPLIAPPAGHRWQLSWCSEDPRYEGAGCIDPLAEGGLLHGDVAVLLSAVAHPENQ